MPVILTRTDYDDEGESFKRTCDSTCHYAKQEECKCICGGKYHGGLEKAVRDHNAEYDAGTLVVPEGCTAERPPMPEKTLEEVLGW